MRAALVLLSLCVAGCSISRPPPPAPPRKTNLGLEISQLELPNGLRVIFVQDPRAAEVQVTMRYRVGAADDRASPGIAHLVEHLMFQQVLGAQSLYARLEDIATSFNAATTYDATTYVSRARPEYLEELLSIEAVRMGLRCTSIDEPVFARERAVVVNEIRQRDAALELVDALHAGIYPASHPYRQRLAGTEATVSAITRDQACGFADAHYAPGNAVLVVSGKVEKQRLVGALGKLFARIPRRRAAIASVVPRAPHSAKRIVEAPIDEEAVLVAWPLPYDAHERTAARAIAAALARLVDGEVKGQVSSVELGDERAKVIALVIGKHADESIDEALKGVERAAAALPASLINRRATDIDKLAFHIMQQGAIYGAFANLEEGSDRDARLAAHALAGRDPIAALGLEIAALRRLTPLAAAVLVSEHFKFERASVIRLKPRTGARHGTGIPLVAGTHDLGQRRDPPDPAVARRPLAGTTPNVDGLAMRRLPNGMSVVLLPLSSAPTLDVRVVFRAGTADDPAAKSGSALLAAHSLTWDLRFARDLLRFAAAGGTTTVDVGVDHTSFVARGLDMHVDYLLAGLRRLVREGRYDDPSWDAAALRREAKKSTTGAFTDAWRTAMFGEKHPYAHAGAVPGLSRDDVTRFRARHYTPDNATLVISGRFDPALANQWIDFLFADWTGKTVAREAPRAITRAASLAQDQPLAQIHVQIAMPASGSRAHQLVAAAMLADIAHDVRHQLGASYAFGCQLRELRLSESFVCAGWIDAARAHEGITLVRSRLERLRDVDIAARAFAVARARVFTQLTRTIGSASKLSERAQRDVAIGRPPLSDLQTAVEVQQLTIAAMTPVLASLDLATAAIAMRGPASDVDRAFAVLGRTARYIPPDRAVVEPTPARTAARSPGLHWSEFAEPLTEQDTPRSRLMFAFQPGFTLGRVLNHAVRGVTVGAQIAYRLDSSITVGLYGSVAYLSGQYEPTLLTNGAPISLIPFQLGPFAQAMAFERAWVALHTQFYLHQGNDNGVEHGWSPAFGLGIDTGAFVYRRGGHGLGLVLHIDTELDAPLRYAGVTFGITYRAYR